MPLSKEQLAALQSAPMAGMPNKLRLARTLLGMKQSDVAEATGLKVPALSDLERGAYEDVKLDANAYPLTEFFGCSVEDLFPRRQERVA